MQGELDANLSFGLVAHPSVPTNKALNYRTL
jgi:hypothetical protein